MGYWIWITTSEYIAEYGDILTPIAQYMMEHPENVGIMPALTKDSMPKTWDQLYAKGKTPRKVNFLDNLATLWRAEFFESVGLFDPDELRGFGVELIVDIQVILTPPCIIMLYGKSRMKYTR